jgi:hypothetical protein
MEGEQGTGKGYWGSVAACGFSIHRDCVLEGHKGPTVFHVCSVVSVNVCRFVKGLQEPDSADL